jgi:hypothetical protein
MGHGIFGRRRVAILYYWIAALAGFAAGYWAALAMGTGLPRVGETPVLEGTMGAALGVAVVRILGL